MLKVIFAFLIAALMGMGVGGGGLFVIFLTLCLNFPQLLAQGTNLLFFIISGLSSLILHVRKRKIALWQVILMIVFGSLGSFIFSSLTDCVNPKYTKIALGVLLVVSGFISLYKTVIKDIIKKIKKTLYK